MGASSSSSVSGSSTNPAVQAALRHKEAGNAQFKRQQYAAAASHYAHGVVVMAQGAGSGPLPQGEERQLLVDLLNNSGLALLRQAEQDPPAAPECLANAAEACTHALDLDPGNSKARYRRALARYKQGKLQGAQQDLASIPGRDDAAVEALRRQLETALQLSRK
jgi:tetratricopeptide (TPR) repeat protein